MHCHASSFNTFFCYRRHAFCFRTSSSFPTLWIARRLCVFPLHLPLGGKLSLPLRPFFIRSGLLWKAFPCQSCLSVVLSR
jgi:hypothetical protein